jgi:hypothetical protein
MGGDQQECIKDALARPNVPQIPETGLTQRAATETNP